MIYRIIQGHKRIVIDSALPVEIQVGETTKEVEAMAIVAAPNLAKAIAANKGEQEEIRAAHKLELAARDEEVERLHTRLGMMAVIFKSLTNGCQFERDGDRWRGLYYVKPKNEDMEVAFNMAQQVDVEGAMYRLMKEMEEGES